MKKITLLLVAAIAIILTSCDGGEVETSAEMKGFLDMIKGKDGSVQDALNKYAADSTVMDNEITMYQLDKGKATGKEGDCYEAEFVDGVTKRMYLICWTNGKISKIEDKGIK